jgi:hypothetical protein
MKKFYVLLVAPCKFLVKLRPLAVNERKEWHAQQRVFSQYLGRQSYWLTVVALGKKFAQKIAHVILTWWFTVLDNLRIINFKDWKNGGKIKTMFILRVLFFHCVSSPLDLSPSSASWSNYEMPCVQLHVFFSRFVCHAVASFLEATFPPEFNLPSGLREECWFSS